MFSLIPEDLTQPGTHALVIGVSAYRHLGNGAEPTPLGLSLNMAQLSAAARSASEFAGWMLRDFRRGGTPLRSLRVLLSPAAGEQLDPEIRALLQGANHAATRANVEAALLEFRTACDRHLDNVAVVYVAGHGVQLTKSGAIVLLHDMAAAGQLTELHGALDVAGVRAGMDHPATARTQLWFVDACRQRPAIARRFDAMAGALTLSVPTGSTETSPIFLAAATGAPAYARRNGRTLFCEALLWALNGGAASGPEPGRSDRWHIPVTRLIRELPDRVEKLAAAEGVEQGVDIAGKVHEAVFHELPATPKVSLHVQLLPQAAWSASRGTLKHNATTVVVDDNRIWPLRTEVDAGLYLLNITADAPFRCCDEILNVYPPEKAAEVNVG